ncbi:MAG: DUF4160 domain-containing protein [Opitutae bacterium]|nr:DUF4160 domain-containing protein [Opitutae bacterium]
MPRAATSMPTIATFHGVIIRLYYHDHQPPHFHALYGEAEALIGINLVVVLQGRLPAARLKDVLAWAQRHQPDLRDRWQRCQNHQPVPRIAYP